MTSIALATCTNVPEWEQDDRPLVAALRQRGAETRWIAWDDPESSWTGHDACLIRTTWNYMDRRDAFIAWAEDVAGRMPLFNPPEVVRWNTHKRYLADLEARGVPVLPTVWCAQGDRVDLEDLRRDTGWPRLFLKPAIGATARETMRVLDDAAVPDAQAHLDRMLATEDMLVQPYIDTVETGGELSAIFIDGELTHAVRKLPMPGDYRVQDDFGASDERANLAPGERTLARSIVESVELPLLYARTDFLRDRRGQLRLTELELVEPSLFFRHAPDAAERLADALLDRV